MENKYSSSEEVIGYTQGEGTKNSGTEKWNKDPFLNLIINVGTEGIWKVKFEKG